jgi:hypothetical protein
MTKKEIDYRTLTIKKLCQVIGLDYYSESFTDNSVFQKYSWNYYQKNEFREWFKKLLYKDTDARRYFMEITTNKFILIDKFIDEFIDNNCWSNT